MTADWREPMLAGAALLDVRLPVPVPGGPGGWPGYRPASAVRAYRLRGSPDHPGPVALVWDFSVFGGSFGQDDAATLAAAVRTAIRQRVPVVTLVRSGGTRLQEGMLALVGIARARIALLALAEAGLPHLSVADQPTSGGVWVSVCAAADLRVAVDGAVVGFSGPRVVEAVTGAPTGSGSHTARSAYDAGLVDALLAPADVAGWLATALGALGPAAAPVAEPVSAPAPSSAPATGPASAAVPAARPAPTPSSAPTTGPAPAPAARGGWRQVARARARSRSGTDLLDLLLADAVPLRAPHGDRTVAARVGRLAGRPVVAVALAADTRTLVSPDGFRLATRAYRLAARLELPVLSLVDTPGADPSAVSEDDGLAQVIGEAMDALLTCRSPTIALLHGEGGSGGALAAAVADVVLVTPDSYFAAIGPEGAAATLRLPARQCADAMGITPSDLLAQGVADAVADDPWQVVRHLDALVAVGTATRLARRTGRWAGPTGQRRSTGA